MPKSCDECYRDGWRDGADAAIEQSERGDLQHQVEKRSHNTHNTHMGEERITARRAFEDTKQEKKKRKKTPRDKKMSRALQAANDRARKNNGDFRKGWNQSRCMTLAHKLCNKM